ncbi:MAG: alpha/beta fold hydrolase [Dehalococcoidia bacterium]
MATPAIRYATTDDGVRIAFTARGDGPPIVCAPAIPFSHLEAAEREAGQRRWSERLAQRAQVIRYDSRGTGLSDRGATDFSLDAMQRDLAAVVERLELDSLTLCGFFNGSPAAIAYAAAHAAVERLVLWGGFARGSDVYLLPFAAPSPATVAALWDQITDTAARTWTASSAEARSMAEFFRACVEPDVALAAFSAAREYDVSTLVPQVQARTLVLHRRDAPSQRFELARDLAARITEASLVVLPGEAASPFSGDIEEPIAAIERFLGLRDDTVDAPLPAVPSSDALTPREVEILALLAGGSANKEIAARLGLSVHTVERHLTNLYGKIGVRSRSEATAYALTHRVR